MDFFSFSSVFNPTGLKVLWLVPLGPLNLWLVQKQASHGWLVVGDGDGTVGHLNLVPGRKALSSSSLGPRLPRKLSPQVALGHSFRQLPFWIRGDLPKAESQQQSASRPSSPLPRRPHNVKPGVLQPVQSCCSLHRVTWSGCQGHQAERAEFSMTFWLSVVRKYFV